MKLSDLLTEDLMILELDGSNREEVMEELLNRLDDAQVLSDRETFKKDLYEREEHGSTGIGFGIAIPHGKSDGVKEPRVAFGRKRTGIDWNSIDGDPATLVFMIAVPKEQAGDDHLRILQALSRKLIDDEFREELLAADSKDKVTELIATM
ncbi:PTS system, fructose-specific IIC component/PTS system, nitrogen regulatory IIA component [Marininema halotolerans]|uniref:PTS system, fructose-specific IIC component/PTS system, nitrogen regulatory IIA component n=1 Tax=Marininema halotolerans TaxID=1155944 RepID=A0A1I6U8V0_9BACL|nr:PTS system, fructose-specific IIC component/PTS system, nitrogen regulatory IIA component [Marininema halotolerans]